MGIRTAFACAAACLAMSPAIVTAAREPAPAGQQALQLRLGTEAFGGAAVTIEGVEDNTTADTNYFGSNHAVTYEALGRITGYYQRADGPNNLRLRYQASVFTSEGAAGAAVQDGIGHTQSTFGAGPGTDCGPTAGVPCITLSYTPVVGGVSQSELYTLIQVHACLAEITVTAPAASAQTSGDTLNQMNARLLNAAVVALKSACSVATALPSSPPVQPLPTATAQAGLPGAPPMVAIDQVLLLHAVKGHAHSTHTLTGTETGTFVATYRGTNAGTATAAGTLTLSEKGQSAKSFTMEPNMLADGSTFFRTTVTFDAVKKTVHLTATVVVTLGSARDTKSIAFTVKPAK